jgi:hypothetical protein
MLKEILDAEMTGVRFSSQQAALVFTERGQAPARNLFTPTNAPVMANGEQPKQEESSIGTIRYLYNGDKVETMPARPSSAFTGFVDELKQDIALGLGGYPGGVLWGTADYKGPSVRAEFAQADRVNQYHQGILEDKVLRPIVSAVILHGISNGAIDAPKRSAGESMDRAIMRATRGSWRFPPRLTIDVGRETQSRLAELSMGATSPQEIASEDGKDAYVRAEEKADFAAFVQELAKTRGVPESSIFLPAGQTLPNNPAQAASVGTQTGKDASEAEAAKVGQVQANANPKAKDIANVPEVSEEIAKLNGAQIAAVLSVLEKLREGDLDAASAASLMISAGMPASAANKVAKAVKALPPPEIVTEDQLDLDDRIVISFENGGYVPTAAMAVERRARAGSATQ